MANRWWAGNVAMNPMSSSPPSLHLRNTTEDDNDNHQNLKPRGKERRERGNKICRGAGRGRRRQNVVRIGLYWSGLTEDPLKFLKDLPSLLEIRLIGAYDGESLSFEEGGFQKLKLIKIRYLNSLNSVIIDKAALPELQELQLGPMPEMKEVPSGIQYLRNLSTLRFYDMSDEFIRKIQPNQGQDYQLLQQIATVLLHKSSGRGKYDTYTLEAYPLE